jgi:hypothetical protein
VGVSTSRQSYTKAMEISRDIRSKATRTVWKRSWPCRTNSRVSKVRAKLPYISTVMIPVIPTAISSSTSVNPF